MFAGIDLDADDRELVAAAQGGDQHALDRLLRRHYDRVYAVCRRVLGHDADAADATQDALIAAVKGLARFDGQASFSTWVYRVATNTCNSCSFTQFIDFNRYEYYIQATLYRATTALQPKLFALRVF